MLQVTHMTSVCRKPTAHTYASPLRQIHLVSPLTFGSWTSVTFWNLIIDMVFSSTHISFQSVHTSRRPVTSCSIKFHLPHQFWSSQKPVSILSGSGHAEKKSELPPKYQMFLGVLSHLWQSGSRWMTVSCECQSVYVRCIVFSRVLASTAAGD